MLINSDGFPLRKKLEQAGTVQILLVKIIESKGLSMPSKQSGENMDTIWGQSGVSLGNTQYYSWS